MSRGCGRRGWAVLLGKIGAGIPGLRRKSNTSPDTVGAIALEISPYLIRIHSGEPLKKYLLVMAFASSARLKSVSHTEGMPAMHASARTE